MNLTSSLAAVLCWAALAAADAARTWTDASGRFTIEAELTKVSADGASVTLRKKDGKEVVLKLSELSDADRKFVKAQPKSSGQRGAEENPFLRTQPPSKEAAPRKVNHRRALLVGVNEYQHFRKLDYCGNDVRALGKRLVSAGFDRDKVVVIHDEATRSLQPDREKITNQIKLLLNSAAPDDLVFLAFAGHGVRIQGKSYLVPYEGRAPESPKDDKAIESLISLDWVYEQIEACPASMKLFLVDACQNRLFAGDQRSATSRGVELDSIGQSLDTAPKGVLLITACSPGEVSHESNKLAHGVFTYCLLEALEGKADYNHDGIISLKEAHLYASDHTEQYVRATFNETQRPYFRGELEGDLPLAECLQMDRIRVPEDVEQIDAAFRRIADGGTITLKAGVYRCSGPLLIEREMMVIGASGDPHDVILESTKGTVIVMKTGRARIQGVTIRNLGTNDAAVVIPQGRLEMSKCAVTSQGGTCIQISGEAADPVVTSCTIHDGGKFGISIGDKSKGTFTDSDIFGTGLAGMIVKEESNPTVTRCKMHDGKQGGILVCKKGKGKFTECEVFKNAIAGVEVREEGDPSFTRSVVHGGTQSGVFVHTNGMGTFEECEIARNTQANVSVRDGGNPTFKGGQIHDSKKGGVFAFKKGTGTFIGVDIFGNDYAGIEIGAGGNLTVRNCKIHDGRAGGVFLYDECKGTFELCDIAQNAFPNIEVKEGAKPTFKNCKIRDGKMTGVFVQKKAWGTFEDCDISGNALAGMEVTEGSNPTVKKCKFRDGKTAGIFVRKDAWGQFEDCEIVANGLSGIYVQEASNPTFKGGQIHHGKQGGICVLEKGWGTFENVEIFNNALCGVEAKSGGNPTVKNCRIHHGVQSGIFVHEEGEGVFEDCEIFGNGLDGVAVEDRGSPTVTNCKIYEHKEAGILVQKDSGGTFEGCDIHSNGLAGVMVKSGGNPTVTNCKIHDGRQGGIFVMMDSWGTFEDCDIYRNALAGVEVKEGGNPTVRRCTIRNGKQGGVFVHDGGFGIFQYNKIFGNALSAWEITANAGAVQRVGNSPNQ